jgi:hypothetical protein
MDFGSPASGPRVDNDLQHAVLHDDDKSGGETALKREINEKTASDIMSNYTEIDGQKVLMGNKDQKKIATLTPLLHQHQDQQETRYFSTRLFRLSGPA